MSNAIVIAMPPAPTYGAVEIKEFIKKNTYRAFIITIAIFLILLLFYWIYGMATTKTLGPALRAPMSKMILTQLSQQTEQEENIPPPPTQQVVDIATVARAGTPVPVPDAQIKADLKEFASVQDINKSLSKNEGQIVDINNLPQNLDLGDKKIEVQKEDIPDENEFIPVEREPNTDMTELQKKIIYPETARRAGVEGQVVVRVLIGKTGKVMQCKVQYSESSMLDQAAIDAVKKCVWTPAIQNGQPITCWVSIPIKFRLR